MDFHWSTLWLILHILSFFIAFGPDFAFPIIGRLAARHPQHGVFATEIFHAVDRRITIPLSFAVPLFGILLIVTRRYDFWKSEWLIVASVMYIVAESLALFVLGPTTTKLLKLQRSMPPGPPPEGAAPPAEMMTLIKRAQTVGMILTLFLITFIVLMVWRPGSAFLPPP
jgi:Predicted integral membrane protein (DUF2269)